MALGRTRTPATASDEGGTGGTGSEAASRASSAFSWTVERALEVHERQARGTVRQDGRTVAMQAVPAPQPVAGRDAPAEPPSASRFEAARAEDLSGVVTVEWNGRRCQVAQVSFSPIVPGEPVRAVVAVHLPRGWDQGPA